MFNATLQIDDDGTNVQIVDSKMTIFSSQRLCCNSSQTNLAINQLCSKIILYYGIPFILINLFLDYPVCTNACEEAEGCRCPFETLVPIDDFYSPIIYLPNTTCTCNFNFSGKFCEIGIILT